VSLPLTLSFGPVEQELQAEIRRWLPANLPPGPLPSEYYDRVHALVAWQARLAGAGLMGLSWPEQYGGRGLGIAAEAVLAAELAGAGAPDLINRVALYTVGPTLFDWGTPDHQARFLPGMLDASEIWCQGFSEPGAGSDLASLTTSARVDRDRLIVRGQKVWTSRADVADWCAALVRTDPNEKRHRGLTFVLIPMGTPGITTRPLLEMNHEPHFSEVFFDDAEVPIANVVGEINGGWKVALSMLGYERGLFTLERLIRLQGWLGRLVDTVEEGGGHADPAAVGKIDARLAVLEAQVYQSLAAQAAGTLIGGQTAVDKLLLAEADQELFALSADLLGPAVALEQNPWTVGLFTSRSVSIYGGTTEIQRNIIARQLLRLPEAAR
jgi:alkylation response protein AidB-like acyl-CoA dehydrogenase